MEVTNNRFDLKTHLLMLGSSKRILGKLTTDRNQHSNDTLERIFSIHEIDHIDRNLVMLS